MRLRRQGGGSGFTLLELMVVVVIIGIGAAVILPEMQGTFQDMLLRSTSRSLASACSLASSQSVTVNQLHRVHLIPAEGEYRVERAVSRADGGGFAPLQAVPGAKGQLDKRLTIQVRKAGRETSNEPSEQRFAPARSTPDSILFYPDGTAEESEVLLRDRDGFQLVLRINPITGRVRVIDLNRE